MWPQVGASVDKGETSQRVSHASTERWRLTAACRKEAGWYVCMAKGVMDRTNERERAVTITAERAMKQWVGRSQGEAGRGWSVAMWCMAVARRTAHAMTQETPCMPSSDPMTGRPARAMSVQLSPAQRSPATTRRDTARERGKGFACICRRGTAQHRVPKAQWHFWRVSPEPP